MRLFPNCKINLGLHVVRRREDGYHDLETIFLPVPICDELTINKSDAFHFHQTGIVIDGSPDQNIVVRAWQLMRQELGDRVGNVDILLDKRIPFGAGLGGGSSDAAFTLKMIDQLFDLNLDNYRLRQLAARLGADSPFFIENTPAYATGIGDQLSPLPTNPLEGFKLLLVKPDEAVSTAEAYRGIIPRDKTPQLATPLLTDAVKEPIAHWKELIVNDFETTVFQLHPLLPEIKETLYSSGALYAAMSGSGSTVFGIFEQNTDLSKVELKLRECNSSLSFFPA